MYKTSEWMIKICTSLKVYTLALVGFYQNFKFVLPNWGRFLGEKEPALFFHAMSVTTTRYICID